MVLGALGSAVAVGLIWWSPSLPAGTSASLAPAPKFGLGDVTPELTAAAPGNEDVADVRGHLTPTGDIVGRVLTTTGRWYEIRISAADGHADVRESDDVLTVATRDRLREVSSREWQRLQHAAHRSSER